MHNVPMETVDLSRSKPDDKSKFTATPEEIKSITEKMNDPQFVSLFHEYMQSLSDPKVREEEEAYLRQAEEEARQSGDHSFEFIFPKPSYVLELTEPGTRQLSKAEAAQFASKETDKNKNVSTFINMCTSDKVELYREENLHHHTNKNSGNHSNWYIPVTVSQKRVEVYAPQPKENNTNKNKGTDLCFIYDAVFHPQTLSLGEKSISFMNLLVEIVVEHINVNYKEQHKVSYRRLPSSVASIGLPKNQTIRTEKKTENNNTAKKEEKKVPEKKETPTSNNNHIKKNSHSLPPFTITHRGRIDFSDAWNFKLTEKRIGVPEELVVEIDFQNKNNHNSLRAADLQVEVSADGTCLEIVPTEQQTLYKGSMVLPFSVEEEAVAAQFHKSKQLLRLTLKVIPPVLSEETRTLRDRVLGTQQQTPPAANENENKDTAPITVGTEQKEKEKEEHVVKKEETPIPPEEEKKEPTETPIENKKEDGDTFQTPAPPSLSEVTSDKERVDEMLKRVAEVRKAREESERNNTNTDNNESEKKEEERPPAPREEAVVAPEDNTNTEKEEEPMPFIQKKVPPTEEEAALQARQDAWRALIEEQEKELQEQEEKEKLAEEKRRLKQERKEKIKQEKEKEDLLLIETILNKRKEIPLSNRFIFEID